MRLHAVPNVVNRGGTCQRATAPRQTIPVCNTYPRLRSACEGNPCKCLQNLYNCIPIAERAFQTRSIQPHYSVKQHPVFRKASASCSPSGEHVTRRCACFIQYATRSALGTQWVRRAEDFSVTRVCIIRSLS